MIDQAVTREVDFDLGDPVPNSHLGFGAGIYRRLGAPRGQLEMRVLVETLAAISGYRVDPAGIEVKGMVSRVFTRVPATWPVAASAAQPPAHLPAARA